MAKTTELILEAVEEARSELGEYVNTLEGYGDMCRQLLGIQAEAKELKRQCGSVVERLNDGQELANLLSTLDIQALRLTHAALGMCAKLRQFRVAALPYGDLLTMVEDEDDADDKA